MSRLEEIAAAHADRPAELIAREERRKFEERQRQAKQHAIVRKAAMENAAEVTGRVIFPGRWNVDRPSSSMWRKGWEWRAYCRWEGLRLVFHWRRGSAGATFRRLEAQFEDKTREIDSEEGLASALRSWGLDGS